MPGSTRSRYRPKWVPLVLGAALLGAGVQTPAWATPAPPSLNADSSFLMAMKSGRVLASEHAEKRIAPASLAKLMTAYLTFQAMEEGAIRPSGRVRIREDTWRMSGSQMFLEAGERVSVDKLLQGLLVAGAMTRPRPWRATWRTPSPAS
ncbi:MAG: D-alanyl-D-alanine carboxypeptidase family protein [Thiohalorhabdus sp.]|uniref:D-alanyl-D-alanine carboxypeptidase family protein n=1 Tax=Thiohalorhabdus sp. TaxID=3094134 RepID=UPI0039804F22